MSFFALSRIVCVYLYSIYRLLLGMLCHCLSLLDWGFERFRGDAIVVSLHQTQFQNTVFLRISVSMENTGNCYWLLTSSPDILGKFLKSLVSLSAAVRNSLTTRRKMSVNNMRGLEIKVRSANICCVWTNWIDIVGQRLLNSSVCFPADDLWSCVSRGQLGSLKNSGFANIHCNWYLQFNRSDLPPGSYFYTSNI